ncbi:MAG: Ig-like domain-containing protein [Alloalcanivorax xenomutans]
MIRGTFNRTLYGTLLITACATVLTACGGSDGSDMPGNDANDAQRQSLLYAYPDDGQAEVPTKAPVVLRFTSDVSLGDVEQSVTLCCDAEGGNLDYTAETVGPDPRGVILTPAQSLSPLTDYTIAIKNLRLRNGTSADRTLRFTTRPLAEGPRSLVVKDDGFAIDRQMPNGDTNEPIMDFSSFRLQFTQPVDRASARYGDTVVLTDSSGETVEATLLINGHYMTVDPKPEYLTPGQSYTLSLTSGLTSTFDEAFAGTEISFTPADSSPRGEPAMLVQRITQSGLSRLTGKNINQVPVNGTLLGEDVNVTQASADAVVAELADVTEYPDVTPIRLPRGTKLTGSAIEMVMIGGEVPAGFGSGPVDMRLTSDATGYLVPNPYNVHNRADALRIVHLLMDVGIATEDPRANGGFTQDIMHIELVGVAEVDTEAGVLNLDAVGMVEPNILGQEYGHGLLSFQLQSYKDQMNAPTAPEDTTGPTLQSWTLGTDTLTGEDKSLLAKPGDPIILNFDEPIDPQSVEGNVTLYKTVNGGTEEEMPAHVYVDGAAIVVKPEEDLQWNFENNPISYEIKMEGPANLKGIKIAPPLTLPFQLPVVTENKTIVQPGFPSVDEMVIHAPLITATYPGFPCAIDNHEQNLTSRTIGRCAGGFVGVSNSLDPSLEQRKADDLLPLPEINSNKPIILLTSKNLDKESVKLGSTFIVSKITNENEELPVPGKLKILGNRLTFTPEKPWEVGSLYIYRIKSSGYKISERSGIPQIIYDSDYQCGVDTVCDQSGLPLQTQAIGTTIVRSRPNGNQVNSMGPQFRAGGPDFIMFFRGKPKSKNVTQILSTKPISDTNFNLFHERGNPYPPSGSGIRGQYSYNQEESGATSQPNQQDPTWDPHGLEPGKNSVKILSRLNSRAEQLLPTQSAGGILGVAVGCNYVNIPSEAEECPDQKFSYLFGDLVTEITDYFDPQRGIKILIWPSMIYATSLDLTAALSFGPTITFPLPSLSGPQIMRMRYSPDSSGNRNQPIEGWISETSAGDLIFKSTVDLYVDAPYIAELGFGSIVNGHNMRSYPISLSLSGKVSFLDDGRMSVEQRNIESVDITVFSHADNGRTGFMDLFIPEGGNAINYISSPIK